MKNRELNHVNSSVGSIETLSQMMCSPAGLLCVLLSPKTLHISLERSPLTFIWFPHRTGWIVVYIIMFDLWENVLRYG